jgi:hypothetical protein
MSIVYREQEVNFIRPFILYSHDYNDWQHNNKRARYCFAVVGNILWGGNKSKNEFPATSKTKQKSEELFLITQHCAFIRLCTRLFIQMGFLPPIY